MEPGEAMDKYNLGWVDYVIGEGMDQANVQQSYVSEEELDEREGSIIFYRYQVMLRDDDKTRRKLGELLREPIPDDFRVSNINLDSTDEDTFGFLDRLGLGFGQYLVNERFFLSPHPALNPKPANPKPRGKLKEYGYKHPSQEELEKYVDEIADKFRELDEKYGV
jgi:hypothetical protein